jgi:predicted metal-dependent HD superfamily phosphohydrolase
VKPLNQERWLTLWQRACLADDANSCYQQLSSLYSQPHRYYHNCFHIADCLREFDLAKHLACHPGAVELAIWFHDAVYDSHAADNEERSAELAADCLVKAEGPKDLVQDVRRLILATKPTSIPLSQDEKLLVDVDLSILGQSEQRFWEYEQKIRQEYSWVPKEVFAAKRAEILEQFLARRGIFSTEWFCAKYEDQARRNLRASISKLSQLAQ